MAEHRSVFVYEYVTGGGFWSAPSQPTPDGSLLQEGGAMVQSVCRDFAAIPDTQVLVTRDVRLRDIEFPGCSILDIESAGQERAAIGRLCRNADWTLLIAPEFDGILLDRCRWIERAGGKLLSPSSDFVALTADKNRTAAALQHADINTPRGIALGKQELPFDFPFPAVMKPTDGAGSMDLRLIATPEEWTPSTQPATDREWRLEEFVAGTPVSVAVLCGQGDSLALPACTQRLSDDGRFRYLGGSLPLDKNLDRRARKLALDTVDALRRAAKGNRSHSIAREIGYVGVDIVLGSHESGREDVVIEINPRLTTSYIGLRKLAGDNLAEAMLAMAEGGWAELSFARCRVEFDSDGTVREFNESPR